MKRIKKMISIMLAMAMILAMNATVFATVNTEETPNTNQHTITINNDKETGKHTYEAYQVFRGDLYEGKLSNITWGTGVRGAELLAELQKDSRFKDCTTAEMVVDVVAGFNAGPLDEFAETVGKYLSNTKVESTELNAPYTMKVSGDGYYLVQDKENSLEGMESEAYTKYILQVVGDVETDAKADAPELDKKIVSGDQLVSSNNGFVGDKVTYQLTSRVPSMNGYEKYYYIVHDNLSAGLTFNDDVEVTIGSKKLTKETDFEVLTQQVDANSNENGIKHDDCNLEIVFKNFINYADQTDASIIITYSATINKGAVIGNEGNPNTAHLQYSNDPNKEYKGDPGNDNKPDPSEVTGETPDKEVRTYVAGIKLTKIDGTTKENLNGAKFQIKGFSEKVILVNKEIFRENADGAYYRLKDGTYTKVAPVEEEEGYTADQYESTSRYEKIEVVDKETSKENIVTEGWVKDGVLTFTGLGAGSYQIEELIAPDGYNKLQQPIEVVITWNDPSTNPENVWTATKDGKPMSLVGMDSENDVNKVFDMPVENKSGSLLPSTGGIGTTIFYIIGGILVVGAAILLVTKKRMSREA